MKENRKTHGWSGSIRHFLDQPKSLIEENLENHLRGLLGMNAANSQVEAWLEEIDVLKSAFRDLAISRSDLDQDSHDSLTICTHVHNPQC